MGQSYDCYTDGGDENRLRALYWENPNSTQHGGETFEHPDKIPEILKQCVTNRLAALLAALALSPALSSCSCLKVSW